MSGFKALNIESDDDSDVEIDNTKEIQIEDALKLYQSALKYHSEGPASFDKAAAAYDQLFQSEIFKYPESQAELQRIELHGIEPDLPWDEDLVGPTVALSGLDNGPSTLPQILYLSHKNYGQFKLEALNARLGEFPLSLTHILADTFVALNHFVQALDKDDSDLDLWQRTATVGELLNSTRIARYCLESVTDGDGEGFDGLLSLPGLEEEIAGEQLRALILDLQDSLSLHHDTNTVEKRKLLSRSLQKRLRPYNDLVQKQKLLRAEKSADPPKSDAQRVSLGIPSSWTELGERLMMQYMAEQHGSSTSPAGLTVYFELDQESPKQSPKHSQPPEGSTATDVMEVDQDTSVPTTPPLTIDEQFPGLDKGRPTVQPQIAPADPDMQSVVNSASSVAKSATVALPTRKRLPDAAGLHDGNDEGRSKSKRLRARESNADAAEAKQAIIDANTRWEYEQQINEIQAADDWMFETVGNLFERAGIVGFEATRHIRQELQSNGSNSSTTAHDSLASQSDLKTARTDMQAFLENYNEPSAQLLLRRGGNLDLDQGSHLTDVADMFSTGGTTKAVPQPPLSPNDGLETVMRSINAEWSSTLSAAWKFIQALFLPEEGAPSKYIQYKWQESFKTTVVRILVTIDEAIFDRAATEIEFWRKDIEDGRLTAGTERLAELVQAIFELHLDIFCLISRANSGVAVETIQLQGDRLQRWSDLAREVMHFRSIGRSEPDLQDQLNLRFLWAVTFHINASNDVSQEHVIECMNDLRALLVAAKEPMIRLQNNAIMPEVSLATLDREISKLTLRDFFAKVTSEHDQDPASVIEGLEPLLEALNPATYPEGENVDELDGNAAVNPSRELVRFLQNSNISLRLSLWRRLRDAYTRIDFAPMAVYCTFRMIVLILAELKSAETKALPSPERQATTLKTIRLLHDSIAKLLEMTQGTPDAFLCIDSVGLKIAVNAFGEILQLLQVFNVFEDSVRVGQSQPPSLSNGSTAPSFLGVSKLVHETHVQIWIILYKLFNEAIAQNQDLFKTPDEDKFDFLRAVHRNLGIRGVCGAYKRAFLRLLKDEFFKMTHVDGYDNEQAQVLYDLYGINCFINPSYELMEHNCTPDSTLDRGVAAQTVDLLLAQASKLPMKELVKHPLKDTIEKVHGTIARSKKTDAIMRNRDVYRAFFKSPINPLDLFECLRGQGNQLTVSPIPKEDALTASKGWYFLMGHIALTKFRSQKRTGPSPTEDLDIAIAFFNQDLDYSAENWETWFRLGQAFDTKIEESVLWSAEKLNTNMQEMILMQKQAIHCYSMATALAHRSASFEFETSSKMTELYADFAMRMYSSSREPFGMQAFAIAKEDFDKFITSGDGVVKVLVFEPLKVYTAWKLAGRLFKKAIAGKSDSWHLHYMYGKCLWKMHSASDNVRPSHDKPPLAQEVLAAFVRALELLPKRDSRDSKREQILEPHYKLVSVVHKLVVRGAIDLKEAKETLDHSSFAQREEFPSDQTGWPSFVLDVLKSLRNADKSNWYHRMVVRSAMIMYEYVKPESNGADAVEGPNAEGARSEMAQQMVTKTRGLQIWKPEAERPGRHFVYTARYTRLFVKLLRQLKDRAWMESLARRVRKKPNDIFEHGLVWHDICVAYIQLLREHASVAEGLETSTFSTIVHEDFLARKEPLEKWMQSQEPGVSPALDVLREVQELKKVNQGLMKPGSIDDLIGDSYALLFNTTGKQLWEDERRAKEEEEANRPPPPAPSPPRHPSMSLNHLMNTDGASEEAVTAPQASTGVAVSTTDALPTRRKTGVGRREIRTSAEACYQKTSPQPSTTAKGNPGRPQATLDIQRQQGDESAANSAPPSIHDSADDESELSELEEEGDEDEDLDAMDVKEPEATPRPIFPGLVTLSARPTEERASDDEQEDVEMQSEEEENEVNASELEAERSEKGEEQE